MLCECTKCTCFFLRGKREEKEKESEKMGKRESEKERKKKNRQMHLKDVISNFDEN